MSIDTIDPGYFDAHKNITKGALHGEDARDLETIINELIDLANELEDKVDRTTLHPEITGIRPAAGPTLAADGSENFTILGTNLLQGQSFASITLGASLVIYAEVPGVAGNSLGVRVIDSAGVGGLAVTYAAGILTIDLDGATPTEDQIATAINTAGTWTGILRANSGGGAAFGTAVLRYLTGGVGTGVTVKLGGVTCPPAGATGAGATSTASLSNTALVLNPTAFTGATPALAANDEAVGWVLSNGKYSNSCSVVLA
jgi:hypothetical protein